MSIAAEQVNYRLLQFQGLTQAVALICTLDVDTLFGYKAHVIHLTAGQRNTLRAALVDVFAELEAAANSAIALGGTVDLRILAEVQDQPTSALVYLNQEKNKFEQSPRAAEILEAEGQLTAVIAEDAPLRDMLATVGEAMKLWVADSKGKKDAPSP